MKSKIKYKILILFFVSIFQSVLAENEFIFESKSIEYKDNKNLIIAKGDVKIIAGINPIKVLTRAVNISDIIISFIFKGAINKLVKFLLQISSKKSILKLMLDLKRIS